MHQRPLFDAPLDEARRRVARGRGLSVPDDVETLTRLIPDPALGVAELRQVVEDYKRIIREHSTEAFPSDPHAQLEAAVAAVFRSWSNPRAKLYRSMHSIPEAWGTAVNIQAMVFGNLGETSATGVAFTRDPSTGERREAPEGKGGNRRDAEPGAQPGRARIGTAACRGDPRCLQRSREGVLVDAELVTQMRRERISCGELHGHLQGKLG